MNAVISTRREAVLPSWPSARGSALVATTRYGLASSGRTAVEGSIAARMAKTSPHRMGLSTDALDRCAHGRNPQLAHWPLSAECQRPLHRCRLLRSSRHGVGTLGPNILQMSEPGRNRGDIFRTGNGQAEQILQFGRSLNAPHSCHQ